MPLDKEKIISNALRFVQKGQHDKALKEYLRILEVEPNEVRILLRVAELCARMGDSHAAVEMYLRVADIYTAQGFFLKAVAVYKNVLKIDENRLESYEKLADLYIQLGLLNDAKAQYSQLADLHEKNGRARELLQTLKRIVDLDPGDILSRVKLGEMFARDGHIEEAAKELNSAADSLKLQGRLDEYTRVAERFFSLRPNAIEIGTELANIYLERRDPKKALQKLQLCYKANPKDPKTLELLADAFGQLEMPHNQIPAFKELYKVCLDLGRREEAEIVAKKLREIAPEEAEKIADKAQSQEQPETALPVVIPTTSEMDAAPPAHHPQEQEPEPLPRPAPDPAPAPAPTPVQASPHARTLTEADIYIKYGLTNKAVEAICQVLQADPDCIEAYRKLKAIHDRTGDTASSVDDLFAIANILLKQSNIEEAKATLAEVMEMKPGDPRALSLIEALEGSKSQQAVSLPPPADTMVVEPIHINMDEDSASGDEDFEIDIGGELEPEEAVLATDLEIKDDDQLQADEALTATAPAVDSVEEQTAEVQETATRVATAADVPAEFEGELEEARFLFEQGLLEEALEASQRLLERLPGEPRAVELQKKIEQRIKGVAVQPAQGEAVEELKDVIEEIPPSQSSGRVELNEILNQFRKSVSETVSPGDAKTHFDLGCAYRDMGLYNDAVNEFKMAMSSEEIELKALHMIAVCHLENKEYDKAINAFKKALYYDEITPEQTLDFLYEIGLAYELLGDPDEALYFLKKVGKKHPGYRDIDAHLERIEEQKLKG